MSSKLTKDVEQVKPAEGQSLLDWVMNEDETDTEEVEETEETEEIEEEVEEDTEEEEIDEEEIDEEEVEEPPPPPRKLVVRKKVNPLNKPTKKHELLKEAVLTTAVVGGAFGLAHLLRRR